MDRYVYFVQQGDDGPIKIGVTADPFARRRTLQNGNPLPLFLLGVTPDEGDLEKRIHERLAGSVMRGEWFAPTPEVLAVVDELANMDPFARPPYVYQPATPEELAEEEAIAVRQWGSVERGEEVAARMRRLYGRATWKRT